MWQSIQTAPLDREIEVATIDDRVHAMAFPCARLRRGWINVATGRDVDIAPTHWRPLPTARYFSCCG